jgi:hypothetical protein
MKCTLSFATVRYLLALSKKGTHGPSIPRVMAALIEEGVRNAIKDGFLDPKADVAAISDVEVPDED